jgi:hypothetical protein
MGVRQILLGSRLDGGPWPSGQTTVRQDFPKISRRNLSCIRTSSGWDGSIVRKDARPLQVISIIGFARTDHGTGASRRLNFNTQFPNLMRVRPDHEGETSRRLKSNRKLPYTMHQRQDHSCQMSGRFIWTAILALWRYASGPDTTSSGRLIGLPFLELGKNQWTTWELIGVRTCCWNVRTDQVCTEASRCDVGVRTEETRRPDRWCLSDWRPNGMTRRPDGWNNR